MSEAHDIKGDWVTLIGERLGESNRLLVLAGRESRQCFSSRSICIGSRGFFDGGVRILHHRVTISGINRNSTLSGNDREKTYGGDNYWGHASMY